MPGNIQGQVGQESEELDVAEDFPASPKPLYD